MDWSLAIDAYCERTGPDFWGEPLNALSNAAFLLAAGVGYALWRRREAERFATHHRGQDLASLFFIGLVAVIGFGSFLFHTFARAWASLADVLPIAVFIYSYFALALGRFAGFGRPATIFLTIAFLALSLLSEPLLRPLFGSSAGYVPALLALFAIGGGLVVARRPQGGFVAGAGAVFALSVALRMADEPFCAQWPLGTHFLWHIFNALTLGLLLVASVRQGNRRSSP